MRSAKLIFALVAVSLLAAPAQATPLDHRASALAGADNLLAVQNDDGSMPWIVNTTGVFQNVQGLTGMGFIEAYKLSLDSAYLGNETSGAQGVRDWLVAYLEADPGAFLSSPNVFFLAEYATVTGNADDMDYAREAFRNAVARYGDADRLVDTLLQARVDQGHTNLGAWDVALFIRAANDIGHKTLAIEMAERLISTEIIDLWDAEANWYELGLSGIMFGLGEADYVGFQSPVNKAESRLMFTMNHCDSRSISLTYNGAKYCDDVQMQAYAVIGMGQSMELRQMSAQCDLIMASQSEDGGFDLDPDANVTFQIAEVTSEAVMALSLCAAPHNTAVTSYADTHKTVLYSLI